jgi:hypothetical protein
MPFQSQSKFLPLDLLADHSGLTISAIFVLIFILVLFMSNVQLAVWCCGCIVSLSILLIELKKQSRPLDMGGVPPPAANHSQETSMPQNEVTLPSSMVPQESDNLLGQFPTKYPGAVDGMQSAQKDGGPANVFIAAGDVDRQKNPLFIPRVAENTQNLLRLMFDEDLSYHETKTTELGESLYSW